MQCVTGKFGTGKFGTGKLGTRKIRYKENSVHGKFGTNYKFCFTVKSQKRLVECFKFENVRIRALFNIWKSNFEGNHTALYVFIN